MTFRRRPKTNPDRGAALVEFAIAFPLFMILVLAAVDFGMAISSQNRLQQALRAAGRTAEVYEFNACHGAEGVEAEVNRMFEENYGAPAQSLKVRRIYNDPETQHEFLELGFEAEPIQCILCWFSPSHYTGGFVFGRDIPGPCGCSDYSGLC